MFAGGELERLSLKWNQPDMGRSSNPRQRIGGALTSVEESGANALTNRFERGWQGQPVACHMPLKRALSDVGVKLSLRMSQVFAEVMDLGP